MHISGDLLDRAHDVEGGTGVLRMELLLQLHKLYFFLRGGGFQTKGFVGGRFVKEVVALCPEDSAAVAIVSGRSEAKRGEVHVCTSNTLKSLHRYILVKPSILLSFQHTQGRVCGVSSPREACGVWPRGGPCERWDQ